MPATIFSSDTPETGASVFTSSKLTALGECRSESNGATRARLGRRHARRRLGGLRWSPPSEPATSLRVSRCFHPREKMNAFARVPKERRTWSPRVPGSTFSRFRSKLAEGPAEEVRAAGVPGTIERASRRPQTLPDARTTRAHIFSGLHRGPQHPRGSESYRIWVCGGLGTMSSANEILFLPRARLPHSSG